MPKGLLKFLDTILALLVVGPLAAWLLSTLRASDGDRFTTPLTSSAPINGLFLLLIVLLLASILGIVSSRLISRGRGIYIAGITLGWAAFTTANVRQAFGDTDGPSNILPLLLEAVVLLPWAAAFGILVESLSPVSAEELGQTAGPGLPVPGLQSVRVSLLNKTFFPSLAAAVVAGGLVAWLVCLTPSKGQAFFAAILGGIAAGWASSYSASTSDHERHPSLVPAIVAVPVISILTLLYVKIAVGSSVIVQARAAGAGGPAELFALARIMPLDWIAGGFFGVPIGATWAASMVGDRQHTHERAHDRARA